jgi:hypothetical protein
VISIEGHSKEDNFRIQKIGRRVFYSFQNREDEEERNICICNRCHFVEAERTRASDFSGITPIAWLVQGVADLMKRRDAKKTEFLGSLFFKDGTVNM